MITTMMKQRVGVGGAVGVDPMRLLLVLSSILLLAIAPSAIAHPYHVSVAEMTVMPELLDELRRLDADGRATVTFQLSPGTGASLVGLNLLHACVIYDDSGRELIGKWQLGGDHKLLNSRPARSAASSRSPFAW